MKKPIRVISLVLIAIVLVSSFLAYGRSQYAYDVPSMMGMQGSEEAVSIDPNAPAKGTILEVKEERGLGTTIDVIVYDGILRRGDSVAVGARQPITTKVKALLKPTPMDEMRDPRERFRNVDEVTAASGVKIVAPGLENALAGAPVYVGGFEAAEKIKKEMGDVEIKTDQKGLIIKADTLGSLEALI